jgi:phosphoserine phosphatase RsbU/P
MGDKASLRRLQLSNFKLDTLLDITLAINENISTDALLKKYEKILRSDLNIGKVIVFNFNKKWSCALASGVTDNSHESINVDRDLLHIKKITNITGSTNVLLKAFDVVIPVYHKNQALAYILVGDIDEERDGISPTIKHLHFFQTLSNIIIVAIENKRLFTENIRRESIKKEMELASSMQTMLIPNPEQLPNNDKLKVAAYYHPHFEVGGDYYDFINLNENEVGFCIADVSGKGIYAALIMSNFQASLRALFTHEISLTDLASKLNRIVMNNTNGEKFITLFIARYNYNSHKLNYINAGHIPSMLLDSGTREITYLKDGCIGLGMLRDIPQIKEGEINVHKKMRLLCYTDGLVEMEDENKVEFGTNEIEKCIVLDEKMDRILEHIIQRLNHHKGRKSYFDDISIIGLEFN